MLKPYDLLLFETENLQLLEMMKIYAGYAKVDPTNYSLVKNNIQPDKSIYTGFLFRKLRRGPGVLTYP